MTEYPPTPGRPRKRMSFRTRVVLSLIVAAVIILVVTLPVVFLLVSTPLHVSVETTYITEPLKSDGKQVDYFAAIEKETYPDNIATDENGFRLLVQHVDMETESEPWHFEAVCKKLGLNAHTLQPEMTYVEPFEFLNAYVASNDFDATIVERLRANEPQPATDSMGMSDESDADFASFELERRTGRPWTLEDLPMLERWLQENGPALDLLGKAVRKSTFCIPLAHQSENTPLVLLLLPNVQAMRSLTRGLTARAYYRIGTGNIDGAIDDIVACKRLGRHLKQSGRTLDILVGIAIEVIAGSIGIAGSLEHPPTKQQLQRLMDELNGLPPWVEIMEKTMRFERYTGLDALQYAANGGESLDEIIDPSFARTRLFSLLGVDWNIVAKRINEHYDSITASGVERPVSSFTPMSIVSRRARSRQVADFFGATFIPALNAFQEAVHRDRCSAQMQRITLAMLIYQCDHGALPPAYSVDAEGNPLHSWRVLLLPYLGQDALYRKIRLDEPWSSEHNQKLHREEVAVYRCPSVSTLPPGQTTYAVVVGPDMPFEGSNGKKLADFSPESQDMILLVERGTAHCWMEPANEIPQLEAEAGINVAKRQSTAAKQPITGIASPHPGGVNVGLRNGAARFVSATIDLAVFRKALRGTNTVNAY